MDRLTYHQVLVSSVSKQLKKKKSVYSFSLRVAEAELENQLF